MTDTVTIKIDAVRGAVGVLLDALQASLGPEIDLRVDGYWHLPVKSAFDLSRSVDDLTIGRLRDDVEELGEIVADPAGAKQTAWHGLAHVIGVLRALELAALP